MRTEIITTKGNGNEMKENNKKEHKKETKINGRKEGRSK
jgi:hypothetical protein